MSGVAFLVLGVVFTLSWVLSLLFAVAAGAQMERQRMYLERKAKEDGDSVSHVRLARVPFVMPELLKSYTQQNKG